VAVNTTNHQQRQGVFILRTDRSRYCENIQMRNSRKWLRNHIAPHRRVQPSRDGTIAPVLWIFQSSFRNVTINIAKALLPSKSRDRPVCEVIRANPIRRLLARQDILAPFFSAVNFMYFDSSFLRRLGRRVPCSPRLAMIANCILHCKFQR